jgi:hypothetical protein
MQQRMGSSTRAGAGHRGRRHSGGWPGGLLAGACLALVLALGLVLPGTAVAGNVPDLYEARVPVADAGAQALDRAFADALGQVLVKVSGRRSLPGGGLVANAGSLVRQYQPLAAGLIRVQFDPSAIRGRLDGAGLPVWGADRPTTLVWLVPTGGGGRPLEDVPSAPATPPVGAGVAESPPESPENLLRREVREVAAARGLPVLLPPASAAGSPEAVARRLGVPLVLVGEPAGEGRSWRWTLRSAEEGVAHDVEPAWTGDAGTGLHGLADRLAARYATSIAGIRQTTLLVSGVRDFGSYGRLQRFLEGLDDVEGAVIREMRGDVLVYTLTVRAGPQRLQELLTRGGMLVPESGGIGPDLARFRLATEAP